MTLHNSVQDKKKKDKASIYPQSYGLKKYLKATLGMLSCCSFLGLMLKPVVAASFQTTLGLDFNSTVGVSAQNFFNSTKIDTLVLDWKGTDKNNDGIISSEGGELQSWILSLLNSDSDVVWSDLVYDYFQVVPFKGIERTAEFRFNLVDDAIVFFSNELTENEIEYMNDSGEWLRNIDASDENLGFYNINTPLTRYGLVFDDHLGIGYDTYSLYTKTTGEFLTHGQTNITSPITFPVQIGSYQHHQFLSTENTKGSQGIESESTPEPSIILGCITLSGLMLGSRKRSKH